MSFILTVWAQPSNTPLPTDVHQAQQQLDTVQATPGQQPEPRFHQLAKALHARFPTGPDGEEEMYESGLELFESHPDNDAYYNIGLIPRDDNFEHGFYHLIVQANDLGLHVMDGQNGAVYLANGKVLVVDRPYCTACHTVRARDALVRKDYRTAWSEYRRLAAQKEPEALTGWGSMIAGGQGVTAHPVLGAALALLSGLSPEKDSALAWCLKQVPESQRAQLPLFLERLRKTSDLSALVVEEVKRGPGKTTTGTSTASTPSSAPDAATAEAARSLGIDPALVERAEAGHAISQCKLAIKFMEASGKSSPKLTQLMLMWLERAAGQGQTSAQALLGDSLLRGWRGIPVNMERGLSMLEASAKADDTDGLYFLAEYLYEKSIRRRGTEKLEKLKDPASIRNQARVPELLTRAAAQGDGRSLFWLAIRLWDEIGTPQDDIAAKAVMQLARTRAAKLCAENSEATAMFTPTKKEASEVAALSREMGANIKQLPDILALRQAERTAQSAPVAAPPKAPRIEIESDSDAEEDFSTTSGVKLHLGHIVLGIGIVGFLVMLLVITTLSGGTFRAVALAVGLISAVGVWMTSGNLGWSTPQRLLYSILSLIPLLGFILCIVTFIKSLRNN